MEVSRAIELLKAHAEAVRSLVAGTSAEQARWKPAPESWSLLEVVNHLYDEEREDFRLRLDYCLNRPGEAWPPINPPGWVVQRQYNSRALEHSLRNFLDERQRSLTWLETLGSPNLEAVQTAPFGEIRTGDMLAAWVAHDLLHLRQLVELHWAWVLKEAAPFDVRYAGEW
jgi:hypothetical protein